MTLAILARDPDTGALGVAAASASTAVGAQVGAARAGVGAVAVLGPGAEADEAVGLSALAAGWSVEAALGAQLAHPDASAWQCLVLTARGQVAGHTGQDCPPACDHGLRAGVGAAGSALAAPGAVAALLAGWGQAEGDLAARLVGALRSGLAAGGNAAPTRSAALRVVAPADPQAPPDQPVRPDARDLRVDDHADPVGELARLLAS